MPVVQVTRGERPSRRRGQRRAQPARPRRPGAACGVVGSRRRRARICCAELEAHRRRHAPAWSRARSETTTRKTRIIAHSSRSCASTARTTAGATARGGARARLPGSRTCGMSTSWSSPTTARVWSRRSCWRALRRLAARRPFRLLDRPEEGELRALPRRQPADPEPRRGEPGVGHRDPRRRQPARAPAASCSSAGRPRRC